MCCVIFCIKAGNEESNKKQLFLKETIKLNQLTKQPERFEEIFLYQSIVHHYQFAPKM
jgi:hypothetical protein